MSATENGTAGPPPAPDGGYLAAVLAQVEAGVEAGAPSAMELLVAIAAALGRLEATLEEYRPLLDMVKARADRGTWRDRFGGKPQ